MIGLTPIDGVLMYQATRVLGVDNYINGVARGVKDTISSLLINYGELDVVATRVSPKDPSFHHLTNNLAWRRHKMQIPDTQRFASYLSQHPELNTAITAIDAQKLSSVIHVRSAAAAAKSGQALRMS